MLTLYKSKYKESTIESIIEEALHEGVKYRYVVSKGRKIKRAYTDRSGYKIKTVNGKPTEVKMSTSEKQKRKKGRKKASRKPTKSSTINKRKKSNKKHTWESVEFQESLFGIDRKKIVSMLSQLKRKYDKYYRIINDIKNLENLDDEFHF